jgi:hypothetical protein
MVNIPSKDTQKKLLARAEHLPLTPFSEAAYILRIIANDRFAPQDRPKEDF